METPRIGPSGETINTPRHRALGSASRVTILRLVRAAEAGVTAAEVAAGTGQHLSTTRAHLGHYPFVSHVMVDAERGARGTIEVG